MMELIVPQRFCGPRDSGNGGWTAGALAELDSPERTDSPTGTHPLARPAVEVSLRQPPPLDASMQVSEEDGLLTASFGGSVVATAHRVDRELDEVEPVDHAVALAAESSYPGLAFHPFPTCVVCGTSREEGDGLRIFPGKIGDGPLGHRVAATWTPHQSLGVDLHTATEEAVRASVPATWAALDCAGGWAGDMDERLMVLGRMTTRIDTLPVIGEPHVVVGEGRGRDGRKTFTATTLYDASGRVVATAEHVWIAVDPSVFGGQNPDA